MTQSEELNLLFKECRLLKEDIHKHKHYTIIKRSGIEKIQYFKKIQVRFEIIRSEPDFASVRAFGRLGEVKLETFASASPKTSTNAYYLEMAEKRALSRIILKLTKLSLYGNVIGEDEFSGDGKTFVNNKSKIAKTLEDKISNQDES